jgi:hypothetical protein
VEYARAWLHTGVKAAEPHLQSAFLAVLAWVAEQLLMAVGSLTAALRDWLDEALGSNVWWSFCVGCQLIFVGYTLHLVKVGWTRFAWWAPLAWHCFIHAFRCLWSIYSYIAARPRLIEHNGVTGVIPPLRGPGGARPFDNIEVRAMFRALGAHRKPYAFVGVVEFQGARHAVRLLRNTGTTLTFTRHGAYPPARGYQFSRPGTLPILDGDDRASHPLVSHHPMYLYDAGGFALLCLCYDPADYGGAAHFVG